MTKRLGAWIGRSVSQAMARGALAATLALSVAGLPTNAVARDTSGMAAAVGTIRPADLPNEAQRTLALIEQGGPFPYAKDGITFGNYERRLPAQRRGYYHEYTVKTRGLATAAPDASSAAATSKRPTTATTRKITTTVFNGYSDDDQHVWAGRLAHRTR